MMMSSGNDDWDDEDECCDTGRCPKCWASKVDHEGGLAEMFSYGGRDAIDAYEFSDETKRLFALAFDAFEKAHDAIEAEGGTL